MAPDREANPAAVRRYGDAAYRCPRAEPLRRLVELIGAKEETHYAELTRRLRQAGDPIEPPGS